MRGGGATLESSARDRPCARRAATQAAFGARRPTRSAASSRDVVADGTAFLWSVVRNDDTQPSRPLRRSPASGPVATVVTLAGQARLLAAGQNRIVVLDGSARVALLDGAGATRARPRRRPRARAAAIAGGVVYVLRSRRIDLHTLGGSTHPLAAAGRHRPGGVRRSPCARASPSTPRPAACGRCGSPAGATSLVALGPEPGNGTDRGLVGATIDAGGILWAVNDRCSDTHVCRGRVLRAPVPRP